MFAYYESYSPTQQKGFVKERLRHRKLNPTEFSLYMTLLQCSSIYTKKDMLSFSMRTPIVEWCVNDNTFDMMIVILNTCKFCNIDYTKVPLPHHTEILEYMTTIRDVHQFLLPYTPAFTDGKFYEHDIDFEPYY